MKNVIRTIVCFLAISATALGGAVLNFESLTGTGEVLRNAPYQEAGFTLTTTFETSGVNFDLPKFGSVHSGSQFYAGTVSFYTHYTEDHPILFRQDGGPFDLLSIDLDSMYLGNAQVRFTGTLAGGGTVTQTFVTDSTRHSMQTFAFNGFNNLVSVSWDDLRPATLHHFDNIVLNMVPEPSSMSLLAIGAILIPSLSLLAIGAILILRKRSGHRLTRAG